MPRLTIDASPNKAGYWMLGGRVGTAVVDEVVPAFFSLLAAAVVEFEGDMVSKMTWSRGGEDVLVLVRGCLERLDL